VNDKGEIIDFIIAQGNVDDWEQLLRSSLLDKVQGKLFGAGIYITEAV
jgi:hypothetical protein